MLSIRTAVAAIAIPFCLSLPQAAEAHCLVGSRFLPATIASEDPCVADELSLPTFSTIRTPSGDEPSTRETSLSWEYAKSITPNLGVSFGQSYLFLKPDGLPRVRGWDNLEASVKYQLYTNAPHEFVLSFGVDADIGGTG